MEKRNIAVSIILTIVTCGIYGIYWFIMLTDETNKFTDNPQQETSGGVAFLLTLVTCGIYGIYWAYKQGEKLDNASVKSGMTNGSRGILYLILSLVGFSIVAYALMQDSINKLIDANTPKTKPTAAPIIAIKNENVLFHLYSLLSSIVLDIYLPQININYIYVFH